MIEPEIAFADLADDADLAEDFLKYVFRAVLDERPDDMAFFDERVEKGHRRQAAGHRRLRVRAHGLRRGDLDPRERRRRSSSSRSKWGMDLQSEHERYLTEKHASRSR